MADPIVLAFVHGWSVTSKDTYGELPEAVSAAATAAGVPVTLKNIYLGRYISFHDEVQMDDLADAMEHAVQTDLKGVETFSCITHSTGGPLVRRWVDRPALDFFYAFDGTLWEAPFEVITEGGRWTVWFAGTIAATMMAISCRQALFRFPPAGPRSGAWVSSRGRARSR